MNIITVVFADILWSFVTVVQSLQEIPVVSSIATGRFDFPDQTKHAHLFHRVILSRSLQCILLSFVISPTMFSHSHLCK